MKKRFSILFLTLAAALPCAGQARAAGGELPDRADILAVMDARRLTEQIAGLTWPFEEASSSSAVRGILGLGAAARGELKRLGHPKLWALEPLPEFSKLDVYTYRDAALAASQNMLIFLGASPGLPRAAVHRVAVRARALLPLLKAEALRISVADPKSLFEKRITEYDKEMAENDKNMLETDSTLSLAELMLALGEYKKAKGTSPARLEEVAPAYIKEIPVWVSRHHSASYKVINYSGSAKKAGEAVTDAGGWLYFNSPESKFYGQVFPNCSHKDQNGKPTYALGGPSSDGPLAGKVTVH